MKQESQDTLYRIAGETVFVPCNADDPKTCYTFHHQAELKADGWHIHRDTHTVYFGFLGPVASHCRSTHRVGHDFKRAAATLAAKTLGIMSVHGAKAQLVNDDLTP